VGLLHRFSEAYRSFLGGYEEPMSKSFSEKVADHQMSQLSGMMDLQKSQAANQGKAYLEDPLGLMEAMGYKDRAFSLSYDVLRKMATKDAVVSSIITTRVNQVSSFTVPARFNRSGIGYEISLRDPEETPSKEDQKTMVAIEQFLENTGFDNDNSRDDFDTFIRKIVRDRLTFDQVTFEIVPDRKGRPAEFFAVDSSTIRVATEKLNETIGWKEAKIKRNEEIKYVQVLDGTIQAYFTANELAFGVSNPRTDLKIAPYGFSELEMLIHQITSHLWAEEYNSRFFSQGGTTKGILNLKGQNIEPHQLEAFKRQWTSQVSGMTGAWKTPVVSVDELEYVNVSQSNREMEFEKWLNYLINIACAVYQIDPSEINFPNRGGAAGGGGGGLGDGGIEERLSHSRDKGLRPLLRFIESMMNKYIVSRFDPKFVFSFVGIDAKSEAEIAELQQKQVKVYKTVNEIRKEEDLEPLPDGDIILATEYIQYLGQKAQQEQQKQMMAMGMGDQGGDDDDDNEVEDSDVSDDVDKSLNKSDTKYLTIELDD
jgi:HK97 family phage portal protein